MRHFFGLPKRTQLILSQRRKVPHIKHKRNTQLIKGRGMDMQCNPIGRGAFVTKEWQEPDIGGRLHISRKKHIKPLIFKK